MTDRVSKQTADEAELTDEFDVVIVPHGTIDKKLVVGRSRPGLVIKVDENRVRSAKRMWIYPKKAWRLIEAAPVKVSGGASPEEQGSRLLKDLSETMDRLAKARAEFRQELRAAVAEGESLLKQAKA